MNLTDATVRAYQVLNSHPGLAPNVSEVILELISAHAAQQTEIDLLQGVLQASTDLRREYLTDRHAASEQAEFAEVEKEMLGQVDVPHLLTQLVTLTAELADMTQRAQAHSQRATAAETAVANLDHKTGAAREAVVEELIVQHGEIDYHPVLAAFDAAIATASVTPAEDKSR
jgi:hypothetical protein